MMNIQLKKSAKYLYHWSGKIISYWESGIIFLLIIALCLSVFCPLLQCGKSFDNRDWMLITQIILYIGILLLAKLLPKRLYQLIEGLQVSGILHFNKNQQDFLSGFKNSVYQFSQFGAITFALLIFTLFSMAEGKGFLYQDGLLHISATLVAVAAGIHIGRMVAFSTLASCIQRYSGKIQLIPGHPDGAGGFVEIGEFYFSQAIILVLPIMYLIIWILIIPIHEAHYLHWREPFFILALILMGLESLLLFIPLRAFQNLIKKKK